MARKAILDQYGTPIIKGARVVFYYDFSEIRAGFVMAVKNSERDGFHATIARQQPDWGHSYVTNINSVIVVPHGS